MAAVVAVGVVDGVVAVVVVVEPSTYWGFGVDNRAEKLEAYTRQRETTGLVRLLLMLHYDQHSYPYVVCL